MQSGFINSIKNELNFHNIQWILVIPATIVITLILAFGHGILTLFTFILLIMVGYLSKSIVIGTKNALITGAISFFLGTLLTGSYLYLILYILLGIVNGLVCGFIGAYLKIIIQRSKYNNTF
jgi:MFS family permease